MGIGAWWQSRKQASVRETVLADVARFVGELRGMEAEDLPLIAALAADTCKRFRDGGIDLLRPRMALQQEPQLNALIEKLIWALQRKGQPERVPGLMVWLHTIRAEVMPECIPLVKEIWSYIETDFLEAAAAADMWALLGRDPLCVEQGLVRTPEGYR